MDLSVPFERDWSGLVGRARLAYSKEETLASKLAYPVLLLVDGCLRRVRRGPIGRGGCDGAGVRLEPNQPARALLSAVGVSHRTSVHF